MTNDKKRDEYSLADIFREMELELISSAKQTLSRHEIWEAKLGFRWEQWQLAKLRRLTEFQATNRKIIRSYQEQIKDTIEFVIDDKYKDVYNKSLELSQDISIEMAEPNNYDFGYELPEENFYHINDDKVNVIIEEMQKTFVNAEGVTMRKMDDVYRSVLDKAVLKLGTGTTTIQKAVDDAMKEFLNKGIDSITYKNGRKVNLASYAEMYLRTANQQAGFLAEGKVRDRMGVYTVLMSQHENCSPMCLPYQGTVMIDDVYTSISKDDASQLARETGYTRLSTALENHAFHPNCRHNLVTFYPGKTTIPSPFSNDQMKEAIKNYNLEQEQRKLEIELRRWKRIKKGSLDEENKEIAKNKVSSLQKQLRDKVKANPNLRRNYWRERVEPILGSSSEVIETKLIPPKPYEDVTQEWLNNIDHSKVGKVIENDFFEKDGIKYVAGKDEVVLDTKFGNDEKEVAQWLRTTFNDDVSLNPRIEKPDGIKSADFTFKEEHWDLKTIEGNSKRTIENRVRKSKGQSSNFVIDTTGFKMSYEDALKYCKDLFNNSDTKFTEKVIVKKGNKFNVIVKK